MLNLIDYTHEPPYNTVTLISKQSIYHLLMMDT